MLILKQIRLGWGYNLLSMTSCLSRGLSAFHIYLLSSDQSFFAHNSLYARCFISLCPPQKYDLILLAWLMVLFCLLMSLNVCINKTCTCRWQSQVMLAEIKISGRVKMLYCHVAYWSSVWVGMWRRMYCAVLVNLFTS